MTIPVTPTERDLRTMLDIVNADAADPPPEGLPLPVLDALFRLIPADQLSFFGLDSRGQTDLFMQDFPAEEPGDDDAAAFWAHYWECTPCSYPDLSGDVRSITKISDFYSARQWHATGMYHDYIQPAGFDHELMLCLPAGPGRTLRLIFFRGPGPDFAERDRALLALLRPHLHQAYVEAERRRGSLPQLTRRHWELLRPGRRRAHQRPDQPQAGRIGGNGAQAPGEHLCPAAGLQPHGRGDPGLPRAALPRGGAGRTSNDGRA